MLMPHHIVTKTKAGEQVVVEGPDCVITTSKASRYFAGGADTKVTSQVTSQVTGGQTVGSGPKVSHR